MKTQIIERLGICLAIFYVSCSCEGPGMELYEETVLTHSLTLTFDKTQLSFSQAKSSSAPPEYKLTDVNLFVFNNYGDLEYGRYCRTDELYDMGNEYRITLSLLAGKHYCIMICANVGYRIQVQNARQLKEYNCRLAYPDEFHNGMLMSAIIEDVCLREREERINVELKRAMSKINVRMDRSRLDQNVDIIVKSIKLGACPRGVNLFSQSRALTESDLFGNGYYLSGTDTDRLNLKYGDGKSETVSLYCFENIQPIGDNSLSTFIQIEADYLSDRYKTEGGSSIYYRFYVKDGNGSYGVERNCQYDLTVMPEGDGLNGDIWRVDKSNLVETDAGESWFKFYPANYIECHIGDTLRLWCDYCPKSAKCIIDSEYLEEDRSRGIYDYKLDQDGRGVSLIIKKGGTGIVLFDVEEPVNDGAMCVIVSEP